MHKTAIYRSQYLQQWKETDTKLYTKLQSPLECRVNMQDNTYLLDYFDNNTLTKNAHRNGIMRSGDII